MSNYTDNNIIFNNVKDISVPISGAIGVRGAQGVDPEFGGIINAIDIDWNDAQLGNKVDSATLTPGEEIIIQTTGQLLSYMSTIAQKLTDLENILINL